MNETVKTMTTTQSNLHEFLSVEELIYFEEIQCRWTPWYWHLVTKSSITQGQLDILNIAIDHRVDISVDPPVEASGGQ